MGAIIGVLGSVGGAESIQYRGAAVDVEYRSWGKKGGIERDKGRLVVKSAGRRGGSCGCDRVEFLTSRGISFRKQGTYQLACDHWVRIG